MQRQITLDPGQSGVVTFAIAPNEVGVYEATLDGLSGSFETPALASLNGNVDLQGWPATEITVRLLTPGTDAEVGQVSIITNSNGDFTATGILPGTYDVAVKGYTSLSILKANELFTGGETTIINFGVLIEGDVNGNDYVDLSDAALFYAAWNSKPGDPNWNPKCDFDRDNWIYSADLSLISAHYGMAGDCAVPLIGSISPISDREIPMNEEILLAISWINESEINIAGHIDLSVEFPDGRIVTLAAVKNQDKEATPGHGYTVEFEPFTSSLAGTYTATATLSYAGQLDSITFNLVATLPPQNLPLGFEILSMRANPSVVILGDEMYVRVIWATEEGIDARPYRGKTYSLHCTIDGATLQAYWVFQYTPALVDFFYSPPSPGFYTARALDGDTSFEVVR